MTAIDRRGFLRAAGSAGLAWCLAPAARAQTAEGVTLTPPCGALAGTRTDGVHRFLGIPFARPPVGPLRFRPPQPLPRWHGMRDATRYAASAIQAPIGPSRYVPFPVDYSEDCLYLNVWAPVATGPHPVHVWVHGGGNVAGTTRMPVFDGASLARAGIVAVSVGYRVGALGFLELGGALGEDFLGSGNNGLLDQVAALAWVRGNIAGFGGDPDRVSVAGQSAGAKNVVSLLAMRSARGLFQRAISQSGGGQTVADLDMAHELAGRMLARLGLNAASAGRLLELPAEAILQAQHAVIPDYPFKYPFRAVVDGRHLLRTPLQAVAEGAARDIPLIIGSARDEVAFFGPNKTRDGTVVRNDLANLTPAQFEPIYARYAALYPDKNAIDLRYAALTAEEYWIPSIRLCEAQAMAGGASYAYRFDLPTRNPPHVGYSVHGSELAFTFGNLGDGTADALGPTGPQADRLSGLVGALWHGFIRNGVPDAGPGIAPFWPTYGTARETLLLDTHSRVVADPDAAERMLWDGVLRA
ncbi:carboxylesterase family protein [Stenotrophomonas sp. MMGLT7]|uniref:carboxylesterase/lipase family protein n=1 Tax=Stenotrophomonas sp. MMGLT7 TaxID=2901227 RepID=UPI001E30422D|nr:carboxylesterase family protein [Stenotrophomonas sp. MMGLT7]MCD7098793.1 carboxylesterase family protein [Stenotrophomonas sp. MMGLT7]